MKKRIVGFLITIIAIMFIPVTVKAEEDKKFDNDRCVVTYSLFLQYDGNEKYLRGGYGILAGIDENGGANNLITCASDIVATDEELQAMYEEYAIDEDHRNNVQQVIKVTVEKDIAVEATINNISNSMNLAVLNIAEGVFNHNGVIFDTDKDNISTGQELYILDNESNYHKVYGLNETDINGIKYVQFDSSLDWEQQGQPLFNENEECIGMVQNSVDGTHKNALSAKEIVVVLKTLGVANDVADHTIKAVEKRSLIMATEMAENIDLTLYTEETAALMTEQIESARSIIISEESTQEEVDAACESLTQAQAGLVLEEKLDTMTLVFIIVSGVLLLGIIIFIIVKLIIKKKKKKKEREKAAIDAKRATTGDGPYVPESKKAKNSSKSQDTVTGQSDYFTRARMNSGSEKLADNSGHKSETLARLDGFAPSSKSITFNEEDTTVLSAVSGATGILNTKIYAHMELKDGSTFDIDKEEFILGKSLQKADYPIESNSVSRAHLAIIHKNGKFYAKDLSSLNGSFIDGKKLNPQEEVEITDMCVLKLADVELVFREGE